MLGDRMINHTLETVMTPIGVHTMAHATLVRHGDDQLEVEVILGPRHLINAPISAIVPAQ